MKIQMRCFGLLLAGALFITGCAVNDSAITEPADCLNVDTKQDIYFATGNDFYDLYVGHSLIPGPEIELLSREYIDPESIQVSMDLQAEYTVYVTQQETDRSLTSYEITKKDGVVDVQRVSASVYDFPLYLYQTYAGMDWAELSGLRKVWLDAVERSKNGEITEDEVNTALVAYVNAQAEYAEEYTKLTVDKLPIFYKYLIQIKINNAKIEETLQTVQVTIGESSYDVEIGQINIHPNPGYSDAEPYLTFTSCPYGINCLPYGEGIEQCKSSTYLATVPVTLTGLHFWENSLSTATILDVTVSIADAHTDVGTTKAIAIKWDGETPVLVEQGKYMALIITFQDERLKQINYHGKLYPVLELERDGDYYEVASEIPLMRFYGDAWLLYALGLDGINMENYFNDYYYPNLSTWRETVSREAWEGLG